MFKKVQDSFLHCALVYLEGNKGCRKNIYISNQVTNQPTAWSRVLLQEMTVTQLLKKLPAFHGTLRFITMFTRAHIKHKLMTFHISIFARLGEQDSHRGDVNELQSIKICMKISTYSVHRFHASLFVWHINLPAVQMWQEECGAQAMPLTQARWLLRRATGVHGTLTSRIITCQRETDMQSMEVQVGISRLTL
jgi:hypothetical protein